MIGTVKFKINLCFFNVHFIPDPDDDDFKKGLTQ